MMTVSPSKKAHSTNQPHMLTPISCPPLTLLPSTALITNLNTSSQHFASVSRHLPLGRSPFVPQFLPAPTNKKITAQKLAQDVDQVRGPILTLDGRTWELTLRSQGSHVDRQGDRAGHRVGLQGTTAATSRAPAQSPRKLTHHARTNRFRRSRRRSRRRRASRPSSSASSMAASKCEHPHNSRE